MTAKTAGDGSREPTAATADVDSGSGSPSEPGGGSPGPNADESPAMHEYRPGRAQATAELPARRATHDHDTVSLPVLTRDAGDEPPAGGARVARRWGWNPFAAIGRKMFWLAAIAGIIVILLLITTMFGLWPKFGNIFGSKTTDRSGPVLLVSIQDLSRFEAASGNFQVIVDLQNNRKYVPDFLFNERSLFVADGSVDAYVDFSHIGQGDIKVDPTDSKKVTVNLPAPQLEPPNLDEGRSYLYATQKGLINRLGDVFSNDANSEQRLYQLGQQKIAAAALDSELPARAEKNTTAMLNGLLKSLGYTSVTVNYATP
ncbi:MAG TPA: DUF4230 domain-containing protein [Micromonosporaceae bacterium]|jgi:hypothetical protein